MTIMFIAPRHAVENVGVVASTVLNLALEQLDDGRCLLDLNVIGAITTDRQQGWGAINDCMKVQTIDSIICFGKTSESVCRDLPEMTVKWMRLRGQASPVRCVKIPSPLSSWWGTEANVRAAASAVRGVLTDAPTSIIMPESDVSIGWTDLN